jgi:hypothetical protein
MKRKPDTIRLIILGTIAGKFRGKQYPEELINATNDVMKVISKITFKEFTEIKKNFKY